MTCVCFDDVDSPVVDVTLSTLIRRGAASPVEPAHPAPTDVASVFFTSGTSGVPKGVVHTHHSIASAIWCFCPSAPFHEPFMTRGHVSYSYLPLAHVYEHQIDMTFLTFVVR